MSKAHFLGIVGKVEGTAYIVLPAVDGLLICHVAVIDCQLFFAKQPEEDGEGATVTIPETPFSFASLFGLIGGVILVVGAIVIWILLKRKN